MSDYIEITKEDVLKFNKAYHTTPQGEIRTFLMTLALKSSLSLDKVAYIFFNYKKMIKNLF